MKLRSKLAALLGTTALLVGILASAGMVSAATGPSDQGVTPTLHANANITLAGGGNNDQADCAAADGLETGNTGGSGTTTNGVNVAWSYNSTSKAVSFVATGGLVTFAYIKGGNDYNEYDYTAFTDGGVASDGHLYAPDNGSNGPAGLSHAVFCTSPGEGEGPESALISTEVHLGDGANETEPTVVDDADQATNQDKVHDSALLTFTGGIELPDGSSVTFSFWENHDCSGEPDDQSTTAIDVSGETSPLAIDPGLIEGPLAAGVYSFKANFTSGDEDVVTGAAGACEPFTVREFSSTEEPATDVPTEPNTATLPTSGNSGPSDSSWLLVAALGVLLASVVVMTPSRVKNRR